LKPPAPEAAAETAAPDGPADWRACAAAKIRAGEAAEREAEMPF
jgi:hypothetical protein